MKRKIQNTFLIIGVLALFTVGFKVCFHDIKTYTSTSVSAQNWQYHVFK